MSSGTLDHETQQVASFDETVLAARALGSGGPLPLLLVPAVGTDLAPWRGTLRKILPERPALTWDLRGFHRSEAPASDRIDAPAHAEDAVAVMGAFGVERAHVAAWSTATPIALQLAHEHPELVASLTLVCGSYGYPQARLLRALDPVGLLPLAAGVGKHFSGLVGGVLRRVVARPELAGLVRQSGFIGPTADVSALVDVLKSIASTDTRHLLATLEAVTAASAPDLLASISAPTLLVAGERDAFTPRWLMQETAEGIPGARLEVYERGTHYVPLEFPARLAGALASHAGGVP